jgi:hypothetical protein
MIFPVVPVISVLEVPQQRAYLNVLKQGHYILEPI